MNTLCKIITFILLIALPFSVLAEGGIIETLKFKDADIKVVLQAITQKAIKDGKRINILISPEVKGIITVDLENVDWQTALDAVLKTYEYGYEWTGKNIILVDTLESLSKKRKKVAEAQVAEPLDTRVFALNFAKVDDVIVMIRSMLSARGKTIADPRTNTIVVTDVQSNLISVEKTMKALDAVTPQVSIEAKIIETNAGIMNKLGVDWSIALGASAGQRPHTWPFSPQSDHKYMSDTAFPAATGFGFGTLNAAGLAATLEVIMSDSSTSIKSMPNITTLDNNTASIDVITEDPLPNYTYNSERGSWEISGYTFLTYGVSLEVTPQINKEGFVTLTVKPKISEIAGERSFSSGGSGSTVQIPILDTQTTSTKVMIKNGETLVIGGLIRDKEVTTVKQVPILSKIPLLGALFKHKSKQVIQKNLLIFITPTIVTPSLRNEPAEAL